MNDNIPMVELPEFATSSGQLARSISFARENVSYRVGYEVELAGLETVARESHSHLRIHWRRKRPELRIL